MQVELTGRAPALHFRVNGQDVWAKAVTIKADAVKLPLVEVELDTDVLNVELDPATVRVADNTRAALIALGWTPPQ